MKNPNAGATIRVKWKPKQTLSDQEPWEIPLKFHPIRDWLAERGVDVASLKNEEHALRHALKLSGVLITKPKWFQMDQALYSLQEQLIKAPPSKSDLGE